MRVNTRVFDERSDMFSDIKIPNCEPKELRVVAERIMNMVTALSYEKPTYHKVTELDKAITINYWKEYDKLPDSPMYHELRDWYIKEATNPDIISRAIRWLVSHNYIFLDKDVAERAAEASDNWRQAVKGKGK